MYKVTLQVTDLDGRTTRANTTLIVNPATPGLEPEVFFIEMGVAVAVAVAAGLFATRRKNGKQIR